MFARLSAALRMLVRGTGPSSPVTPATCQRCGDLERQVDYWRTREERTADALLHSKGVLGRVASPIPPKPESGMAALARGLAINEIESSKSKQPGQGSLTRGAGEH